MNQTNKNDENKDGGHITECQLLVKENWIARKLKMSEIKWWLIKTKDIYVKTKVRKNKKWVKNENE